ncbi:MAG: tRNA (adenosine(37)-N6)-threonylcarbamoyltransferase complex ATPase subunit type 1 TsaE [Alphaproteobacteria bacterium]|uniref:tRNA threonylcarbamoyladenosine biosynthesis protein TsaE n=1 Tax=Candidatus Nitrobium versatile TaxID=2884831 RepID=A0A953JDF2_9BACT|nr:tRNA (adenosine(37)-N6)-threonylcarbamoyltransferase complex ATPase subunit type 1 TsaE [Candidatus Nitrobium versatile]
MRIITESPEETEAAGRALGRFLKEKKKTGAVFLFGDLGAGKTTFIKGIASAFGIPERDIGSASFVIAAEYETTPPFYHIDLYRMEGEEDSEALGIWEYIESGGVAVVEWSERLSSLPGGAVTVTLSYHNEHAREILVEGVPDSVFTEETRKSDRQGGA